MTRRVRTRPRRPKLGRNDLCSCGSGLKYKKCCLWKAKPTEGRIMASKDGTVWQEAPPDLRAKAMQALEETQRKEQQRIARFGRIRPQISMVWQGQRTIAVRNRIYRSDRWRFFPDFLRDYVPEVLGVDW